MTATVTALLLLPRPPRWLLALAVCAAVALAAGLVITLIEQALKIKRG